MSKSPTLHREIVWRTKGHRGGPITRLMSPSDLGKVVKPFVFLDIFDTGNTNVNALQGMPIHPHSGVATVTVFTEGAMHYNDPNSGTGLIGYGGVEWMRSGHGIWHGKELFPADVERIQGFQLWLSLPEELELSQPESFYLEEDKISQTGPAKVIVGEYEGVKSPLPTPDDVNYLLVRLQPGERWTYQPPKGHSVGWMAIAKGNVASSDESIHSGEMIVFSQEETAIEIVADKNGEAIFVLGSAVPHPHDLHLGYYSVHTSQEALNKGEARIVELKKKLDEAGDRQTQTGNVPVFH
ncbi:pirin family protein [Acinetobacter shaoyimingii]|uniref:Pirin family protein n=1 Tax=Acinetobacter shaoyimingii TaxID=2715164 RepID=A0A6G8RVM1_9GAMM|nr:pirin family protein [Acinetobacter shaoyimingii]QIO05880.1 pirin family protein [Acinetobacter shaoyimingii]